VELQAEKSFYQTKAEKKSAKEKERTKNGGMSNEIKGEGEGGKVF